MKVVQRRPASKPSTTLKQFLDATKKESRLLGAVDRHLLAQGPDASRLGVLHPSQMCRSDWCSRAAYHELVGSPFRNVPNGFHLEKVFGEGHAIHHKWQTWFAEMGVLHGQWECLSCFHKFWATSPVACERCNWVGPAGAYSNLRYREVPLQSDQYRIGSHADGWIKGMGDDCLIEIKSVGLGTVRLEAPSLLAAADGDLEVLWKSIRRPFPKHIRQGQLYLELLRLMLEDTGTPSPEEIVFVYEFKPDQRSREFVVGRDRGVVAEILEQALDVVWAAAKHREPDCQSGQANCEQCRIYGGS